MGKPSKGVFVAPAQFAQSMRAAAQAAQVNFGIRFSRCELFSRWQG
jgi:hypothetical protein